MNINQVTSATMLVKASNVRFGMAASFTPPVSKTRNPPNPIIIPINGKRLTLYITGPEKIQFLNILRNYSGSSRELASRNIANINRFFRAASNIDSAILGQPLECFIGELIGSASAVLAEKKPTEFTASRNENDNERQTRYAYDPKSGLRSWVSRRDKKL